jgi:hypothetical protein
VRTSLIKVRMFRDPRREDHTIWTAVAPDEVFTVRTYATSRDYEPRPSAQIWSLQPTNQQVTALRLSRSGSRDKSQARQHAMIIADKTIANPMAYASPVLQVTPGSREAAVLDAMKHSAILGRPPTTPSSTGSTASASTSVRGQLRGRRGSG